MRALGAFPRRHVVVVPLCFLLVGVIGWIDRSFGGAETPPPGARQKNKNDFASQNGTTDAPHTVRLGPGIPTGSAIPFAPPVVIDYRQDASDRPTHVWQIGVERLIRGGYVGAFSRVGGGGCSFDIECDDCNPCTSDSCADATCQGGDTPGSPCQGDLDCPGTEPTPDGACVSLGASQCVHVVIGEGVASPACDDGSVCNGLEYCIGGFCAAGEDDLCAHAGQCEGGDNGGDFCDPTQTDPDPCSGGTCVASVCVEADANCIRPCTSEEECDDGLLCTGTESCIGGLCVSDGVNPCGPGAGCTEPVADEKSPTCALGRCCQADGTCSRVTYPDCSAAGGMWLAVGLATATCDDEPCPSFGGGIAPLGSFVVPVGPISTSPCNVTSVGDDYTTAPGADALGTGFIDIDTLRFVAAVDTQARLALAFWDSDGLFVEDVVFPSGIDIGAGDLAIRTVLFDPPFTIPTSGFFVVSVASSFTPEGRVTVMATDTADVGTNDGGIMFINGSTVTDFLGKCSGGVRDGLWCDRSNPTDDAFGCPSGSCDDVPDILAFELIGRSSSSPLGACCDSQTGACSRVLPWVCTAPLAAGGLDGFFQGRGTNCLVCSTDIFRSCEDADDCAVCVFSANADAPCDIDQVDPPPCPGGLCQVPVGALCLTAPPACGVQACCVNTPDVIPVCVGGLNPGEHCPFGFECVGGLCTGLADEGDCISMVGTCAIPGPVGFIPCSQDEDCGANGPCFNNTCPTGSSSRGFGSSCDPNCCEQPNASGGDNCLMVSVFDITVPALDALPLSLTITGSNSSATPDDFETLVCIGGTNDGGVCVEDGECGGGNCTGRLCQFSQFDPDGSFADPGWWEAFHLNACADVRVDLCCSDPVVEPAWTSLFFGCPCAESVTTSAVEEPIGLGENAAAAARGAPFCNDDNVWMTFASLPAGTYYYPIFSGLGGSISTPPGGQYQLHFEVRACPIAACCTHVCTGGTRDGLPCDPDGGLNCGRGACSAAGACVGGVFDGVACDPLTGLVDHCSGGACSEDTGCAVVTEAECLVNGGYWLSGGNTPARICVGGDNDGDICELEEDCPKGSCSLYGNIVSCGNDPGGADNPCRIGSCCRGPGVCDDDDGLGGPMDESLCEDILDPAGIYVGGGRCGFAKQPCPICSIISTRNCQFPNGELAYDADPTGGLANLRIADDFVPAGNELRQLCWWAVEQNFNTGNACAVEPEEDWTIRFYEDDGGLPGSELTGSPGPVKLAAKGLTPGSNIFFEYSVLFDQPIAVEPGQRYWVEISGSGNGDDCNIAIFGSLDGNGWSLWDVDGDSWTQEDRNRYLEDFGLCLDTGGAGIESQPPMTGACCECNGTCVDGVVVQDCVSALNVDGDIVGSAVGEWFVDQMCAGLSCEPRVADGDDCDSPITVKNGTTILSTFCTSTDGRTTLICEENATVTTIESDIWLEYSATCTGRVRFELCADTDFDSILAVFTEFGPQCPTDCPPPLDTLANGACNDLGCNTFRGGAIVETFAFPGQCYRVRVAADAPGQQGRGRLEVTCIPLDCLPAQTPTAEMTPDNNGLPVISAKNRYLSFELPDQGRSQAVRVTFEDLPLPYHVWNGAQLWLGQTAEVGENGSSSAPLPAFPIFQVATLQCDGPVYRDWNALGTIHIVHEGIVPKGRYLVQVLDESCVPGLESSFSGPLEMTMSRWGDVLENCTTIPCTPPEGVIQILDVQQIVARFISAPNAIVKARADLEPRCTDLVLNISDVLLGLNGFLQLPYPFEPSAATACESICTNPLP